MNAAAAAQYRAQHNGDATQIVERHAELVRRIVGLAHVIDIDTLDDAARLRAQRRAVAGARSIALGTAVRTLDDLWNRMTTKETSA